MCEIEFDGYFSVYREQTRKARKDHKCDCCHRVIKAGESYLSHFSVFEGKPCSEKMCADCENDRGDFFHEHGGGVTAPSSFLHYLYECVSEEPEPQWVAMKERIKSRAQVEAR